MPELDDPTHARLRLELRADSASVAQIMNADEQAAENRRRRTFRKFSYRGVEVRPLAHASLTQAHRERYTSLINSSTWTPLSSWSSSTLELEEDSNEDSSESPWPSSRSCERPRRTPPPETSPPWSRLTCET